MGKIVFGGGLSHTPLLTMKAEDWVERAKADLKSPGLNLSDGRMISYADLQAERGEPYANVATFEAFQARAIHCDQALVRFADDLERAAPDVVIIVDDDQEELFSLENMPAISLYYGEKIVMHAMAGYDEMPSWAQSVWRGYAMDQAHVFDGHPALAMDLVTGMIDANVDVASSSGTAKSADAGFGHAIGFVVNRVFRRKIPIVPVLLNTYYPPSVVNSARAYAIGQALAKAVAASKLDLRVAIIASGGLSHFVVDEALDHAVLDAFTEGKTSPLQSIPRPALNSGSSEILNWVLVAGAIESLQSGWQEYEPVYRTPAGTGVGIGVAVRL
jgi:hypothetical protein